MQLKQCNKQELLFVIDYLKRRLLRLGDVYLADALAKVELERENQRLTDAARHAEASHNAMMEYAEIMRGYEGQSLSDIPFEVLNKARICLHKAERHDKEWGKLMNMRKEKQP